MADHGGTQTKNRIEWIDCAKGLCICFVILMHVEKPMIYSRICVPIFLTTFFFTSGFCFNGGTSVQRSARKFLTKFALYGVSIAILFYFIDGYPPILDSLIGTALQLPTHPRYPCDFLWFLTCMILAKVIFGSIYKISPRGGGTYCHSRFSCWGYIHPICQDMFALAHSDRVFRSRVHAFGLSGPQI